MTDEEIAERIERKLCAAPPEMKLGLADDQGGELWKDIINGGDVHFLAVPEGRLFVAVLYGVVDEDSVHTVIRIEDEAGLPMASNGGDITVLANKQTMHAAIDAYRHSEFISKKGGLITRTFTPYITIKYEPEPLAWSSS